MDHKFRSLECILAACEDLHFAQSFGKLPEFRKKILAGVSCFGKDETTLERILPLTLDRTKELLCLERVPQFFLNWNHRSRRVFVLTAEVQTLLSLTSLDNFSWDSIVLPFDTFAIYLDSPIEETTGQGDQKKNLYDLILVNKNGDLFEITAFSKETAHYQPLSGRAKEEYRNLIIRANTNLRTNTNRSLTGDYYGQLFKIIKNVTDHLGARWVSINVSTIKDQPKSVGKVLEGADAFYRRLIYIALGMPLYLMSLGAEHREIVRYNKPFRDYTKIKGRRAIANEAELCLISNIHKLSRQEATLLAQHYETSQSFEEMTTHWVRGHWRRPPGKGKDPNHPKVVMVKPYIVNKDNLKEGELPISSATIL